MYGDIRVIDFQKRKSIPINTITVQFVAKTVQEQAHRQIASVVTRCLERQFSLPRASCSQKRPIFADTLTAYSLLIFAARLKGWRSYSWKKARTMYSLSQHPDRSGGKSSRSRNRRMPLWADSRKVQMKSLSGAVRVIESIKSLSCSTRPARWSRLMN